MTLARAMVVDLQTRDDLVRADNLAKYIQSAREGAIGLGIDWGPAYWPGYGYFVKRSHAAGKLPNAIVAEAMFDAAFIDFSKAYVVERHLSNPGQSRTRHTHRLSALRMLEEALLERAAATPRRTLNSAGANPLSVDLGVLDMAAAVTKRHLKVGGAHQVGLELKRLATLMSRRGIIPAICAEWSNPNRQPRNVSVALGIESARGRQQRLPDDRAVLVLAEIFNRDFDPSDTGTHLDVYVSAVMALLACAPSRVEEIHRLPVNLAFEATDKFGDGQMGLRLHASKGFGAYIKWVWSGMVPVAQQAIERIKVITDEARHLALYMEEPRTNKRFFRHGHCPDVGDDDELTPAQLGMALGYLGPNPASTLRKHRPLGATRGRYTLQRLWDEFVLPEHARLHPHFPYLSESDKSLGSKGGVKFSEALFCMRRHQLNSRCGTSPVFLWLPNQSDLNHHLSPGKSGRATLFARHAYTGDNGEPIKITSHQMRHLLNTEAQRTGLSDEQIAHWSGRKHVAQNAVYDHRPISERVAQARGAVEAVQDAVSLAGTDATQDHADVRHGPWVIKMMAAPRSAPDIDELQPKLTGLQTMYGECHHDWQFEPCEGFVACLNCSEHACIKGTDEPAQMKMTRLRQLHQNVLREVDRAQMAALDDVAAQDWLQTQMRYAAKLAQLIAILQDENVPDGAIIRSADGQQPTHIHRALLGLATKALQEETAATEVMHGLLDSLTAAVASHSDVPRLAVKEKH